MFNHRPEILKTQKYRIKFLRSKTELNCAFDDSVNSLIQTKFIFKALYRNKNQTMSTPDNTPDNDQETNDDGLDLTTPNDNQELDKINDATQAAEPSFTLNLGTEREIQKEKDEADKEDRNIKQ